MLCYKAIVLTFSLCLLNYLPFSLSFLVISLCVFGVYTHAYTSLEVLTDFWGPLLGLVGKDVYREVNCLPLHCDPGIPWRVFHPRLVMLSF